MSTETAIQQLDDAMNMHLIGEPDKAVERATKACTVLMDIVKKRKLYTQIGKQWHLKIEAWLLLAHFYGVTVRTVTVSPMTDELTGAAGYEAMSEAVHMQTGKIVGQAFASCVNSESNWAKKDSYQLKSMAQTRANSKALSSALRWVVILGGGNVDGTPAEEMDGSHDQQPQQRSESTGKKITDGQRKRIFAIAKEHNVPMNDLPPIWQRQGFNTAADITQDKYDGIVAEIQNWKAGPQ